MDIDECEGKIEEYFKNIKQCILNESKALEEISNEFNSSHETIRGLEAVKTLGSLDRIITWFLAITIGTLLWILSNFDKFRLFEKSPPLMPYKDIYMLSIIFIALSSILLITIQSILYIIHHRNEKDFSNYEINYRIASIKFERYMRNWNKMAVEFPLPDKKTADYTDGLQKELKKILKSMEDLKNERMDIMDRSLKNLDQSTDVFVRSAAKLYLLCQSEYILLFPAILYILGFALISAYILIFINFYID